MGYQPHKNISGKQLPKSCSKCDYIGDNFGYRHKKGKIYYSCACRPCTNKQRTAAKRKLRETNPEKWYRIRRHDQLMKCYGISLLEYERMLREQDSKCAICGRSDGSRSMPMDHNHATNTNRQILCHWCNKGLGQFFDNPDILTSAAEYLRKWGK